MRISMDGRGRWMDNVFIERLWRSLKYEDVYLKGYANGREAKAGISDWIIFYNEQRLHQALGYRAPMAVWRERAPPKACGHVDNANALTTCPQGGSETADTTLGGLIKDIPQTHFQPSRRQKRSRCAGPLHSKVGKIQVSIEVSSVIRASADSFRVPWTERRYVDEALAATERWSAILTIVLETPIDADRLKKHPLGVYIHALNWSKELG